MRSGQKETGAVYLPVPDPQDGGASCFQGVARRANMVSQGVLSGPFGAIFDVAKSTWGGKFVLKVTSGVTGAEDLDIYFFSSFGPAITDDPTMNSPVFSGQ